MVHDSLSLYAGYPDASHQLCGAHLVRELTAAEQDHPKQKWPQQIRWALAGLNRQARRVRSGETAEITPEALLFYQRRYHQGVSAGLALHRRAEGRKQSPARNLLERLRDQADNVLRFADHPKQVPFTNNTGGRALRPVKTQVKISGCHQSDTGAAAGLAVRSYLDSARKHGMSAFEAIHRAFTGNLWMPPIAPTHLTSEHYAPPEFWLIASECIRSVLQERAGAASAPCPLSFSSGYVGACDTASHPHPGQVKPRCQCRGV
ncbi:IS66 family transposase [Streptomyces sp. NBC_00576]|uniref:IS66 family transposase n=1 Tax=Streptomyces sp. NBC_00576 TaxID=2903665 RepID=UPI002E809365|nr:transposase [Streptomyces sp. NBC_00576]WUB77399.1 transposase [Streptomyces sp. NBC_00576]